MLRWFRVRRQSLPDTALAMVDPRADDSVLFTGAQAPALAAACGAVTRLNGRTVVLARSAAETALVQKAADAAGALVEIVHAPGDAAQLPAGLFQIVVAPDISPWREEDWPARLAAIVGALAPGGRLIAMARRERVHTDRFVRALTTAGFVAARRLAEADRVEYYEARSSRK
jgi:hypothetical protein